MIQRRSNPITLKKIRWFYIATLLISAIFSRQLLNVLIRLAGASPIHYVPWLLLSVIFLLVFWDQAVQKRSLIGACSVILSIAGIFLFLKMMRNPDERIHLFQYGGLGFLAMAEQRGQPPFKSFFLALWIVLLTACADETFQAFLPYRVGDIRDVGFGLVGGGWGALMGWIMTAYSCHRREKTPAKAPSDSP